MTERLAIAVLPAGMGSPAAARMIDSVLKSVGETFDQIIVAVPPGEGPRVHVIIEKALDAEYEERTGRGDT